MNQAPQLSVIVPVYNEEKTVVKVMGQLAQELPDAQVVYVDDGSKDASLSLLKTHAREVDTVLHKENGGKGTAVREGLKHAQGTYTIIQDADLEYDPVDIPILLRKVAEHNLKALFGSRRLLKQKVKHSGLRYYLGGNLLSSITNILFGTNLTDVMTCYKLVETNLFKSLPLQGNGFDLEVDIASLLAKKGIEIKEVGISYYPRSREEGKKINWKDFFRCLKILLQRRLG